MKIYPFLILAFLINADNILFLGDSENDVVKEMYGDYIDI